MERKIETVNMNKEKIRRVVALGRTFHIGQLYDGITETAVISKPYVLKSTIKKKAESMMYNVLTGETLQNKMNVLGIDADLRASIVGGLVVLKGPCEYLNARVQSDDITLYYQYISHSETLNINTWLQTHIDSDRNDIAKKDATHVVCGIIYGCQLFFHFENPRVAGRHTYQTATTELLKFKDDLTLLPKQVETQISDMRGRCYTDHTYKSPIAYREFAQTIKRSKIVAIEILLYPLNEMFSLAASSVCQVSVNNVSELEDTLTHLRSLQYFKASTSPNKKRLDIIREIEGFQLLLQKYKVYLTKEAKYIIKSIRRGNLKENALEIFLQEKQKCIFGRKYTEMWMQQKILQLLCLEHTTQMRKKPGTAVQCQNPSLPPPDMNSKGVVSHTSYFPTEPNKPPFSCSNHGSNLTVHFAANLGGKTFTDTMQYYLDREFDILPGMFKDQPIQMSKREQTLTKIEQFKQLVKTNMYSSRFKFNFIEENYVDRNFDVHMSVMDTAGCIKEYQLPSTPGPVEQEQTFPTKLIVKLPVPQRDSNVCHYEIRCNDESLFCGTHDKAITFVTLASGKSYDIQITAFCSVGRSEWSECSEFRTSPVSNTDKPECTSPPSPVLGDETRVEMEIGDTSEHICIPNTGTEKKFGFEYVLVNVGKPNIYHLKTKLTVDNVSKKIQKCELGQSPKDGTREKIIMVVGATGAGKTTIVNGMVNYVLGVHWEDTYRYNIVVDSEDAVGRSQAHSQTEWITSYTLHHQEGFQVPYSLTIIDTPGFGDMNNKEISQQIQSFLSNRGYGSINAIGFVIQASIARLTQTQQFISYQILKLFGEKILENMFLLVTFADWQIPPVIAGVKMAKIPYKKYFKFNNSALYAENLIRKKVSHNANDSDSGDEDYDKMFWQMGEKNFQKFFQFLDTTPTKVGVVNTRPTSLPGSNVVTDNYCFY